MVFVPRNLQRPALWSTIGAANQRFFRGRSFVASSLADILQQVQDGRLSASQASNLLAKPENLESFANLDHNRHKRTGFPEAVFAEGKTPEQTARILDDMARACNERLRQNADENRLSTSILATRVSPEMYLDLKSYTFKHGSIKYHETARIVSMQAHEAVSLPLQPPTRLKVVVATAGTTDLPVAEEAAVTLEAAGCEVVRVFDSGVAGLHRIINNLPKLQDSAVGCVIVCAGMDGALPSVVGGLVQVPVLAVPTSVGYGACFGGVSAMLTMLNSCAPGVGVLNIDNGFGAAALAFKIIKGK